MLEHYYKFKKLIIFHINPRLILKKKVATLFTKKIRVQNTR